VISRNTFQKGECLTSFRQLEIKDKVLYTFLQTRLEKRRLPMDGTNLLICFSRLFNPSFAECTEYTGLILCSNWFSQTGSHRQGRGSRCPLHGS
jgi:hypothetical protein